MSYRIWYSFSSYWRCSFAPNIRFLYLRRVACLSSSASSSIISRSLEGNLDDGGTVWKRSSRLQRLSTIKWRERLANSASFIGSVPVKRCNVLECSVFGVHTASEVRCLNDSRKTFRKDKDNKEGKKKGGGFTKLCSLSPQLKEFLGVNELPRTEVVRQIWAHIRECNLQDPDNRRNIICDEKLRELFRVESINMFQMIKVLSKHIWPHEDAGPTTTVQKKRPKKQEKEDDLNTKEKRPKGANTGFLAPLPLSEAMVKFFGTGESSLSRSDVVKRIWEYIKQNDLQDPSDKRKIICDEKLKELFNVDTFNGFTVPKLLTPHFMKAEQRKNFHRSFVK